MKDDRYITTILTCGFIRKVLKYYTQKLTEIERRKNGARKIRVTKKIVCDKIMKDMQEKELI